MKALLKRCIAAAIVFFYITAAFGTNAYAKAANATDTKINYSVDSKGIYSNWEGVSNVSQFLDEKGNYCFAYYKGKKITIAKTKNGKVTSKVKLKMPYPIFGAVTCDSAGNYYVVSGKKNTSSNHQMETLFVSRYSSQGKLIQTVGDNGSYGLASYYDDGFYTSEPFSGGNCDVSINGNFLAVNYARHMYNGHQSNTALIIDLTTMQKQKLSKYYNSHSFAQRAIPYQNGFMLASEGDAYNRAFSVAFMNMTGSENTQPDTNNDNSYYYYYENPDDTSAYQQDQYASEYYSRQNERKVNSYDVFHFWIKPGSSSNMFIVNNNFAHLGGIAVADNNHVALVGSSAKALNKKAQTQKEALFIQIFDPTKDLSKPEAYINASTRSGMSGMSGTKEANDYGIVWLTNGKYEIINPQVVADSKGRFVVLFEKYSGYQRRGVYYTIVDKEGNIVKKITRFSSDATLNSCETPKVVGNTIVWTANKTSGSNMYVFRLKVK